VQRQLKVVVLQAGDLRVEKARIGVSVEALFERREEKLYIRRCKEM